MIVAAFVAVERRTERPMMDVTLFKNPRFTAASGSITIGFFVLAGFTFLITQYFQFVKAYTPFGTLRLLPVAMSIAVAAVAGFLHSVAGALKVAGAVALAGAILAALLLPARPKVGEDPIADAEDSVALSTAAA